MFEFVLSILDVGLYSLRKRAPLVPITEMELEIFNAVANPRLILPLCLFRNVSSFTLAPSLSPKEGAVSILCTAPPKKRSDESSFLRSLPFPSQEK